MTIGAGQEGVAAVAAILLTVGRDRAARLLSHFDHDEVTLLSRQSTALGNLPQERLERIAMGFERAFADGAGLLRPGASFSDILNETRADVFSGTDIEPEVIEEEDPWQAVAAAPDKALVACLVGENPVILAYVVTRLPARKAARLLTDLDPEQRGRIARAALTSQATPHAARLIGEALRDRLAADAGEEEEDLVPRTIASIINCMDRETGDALRDSLRAAAGEETLSAISRFIFRFDDIAGLDKAACAKLCDAADNAVLTTALCDAPTEVREALLSGLGQRARRMIESELDLRAAPASDELQEARLTVARLAIELAADGEITLPAPK